MEDKVREYKAVDLSGVEDAFGSELLFARLSPVQTTNLGPMSFTSFDPMKVHFFLFGINDPIAKQLLTNPERSIKLYMDDFSQRQQQVDRPGNWETVNVHKSC